MSVVMREDRLSVDSLREERWLIVFESPSFWRWEGVLG